MSNDKTVRLKPNYFNNDFLQGYLVHFMFLKGVADFFVRQEIIPSARDNYDSAVDIRYLEAASEAE